MGRMDAEVIIIGAGLSGLACAIALRQGGVEPLVLETAKQPGGRIATDQCDGFLLDRGFQVLQTWYPAAQALLDYSALDLRPFYPGALVQLGGRLHRVSDIWRRPARLPEMLASPIGGLGDKLRLLRLRQRALAGDLDALYRRPETTALALLREQGFSARMIERFFRPFFAGVFFEPDLSVSSRTLEFVFRAFALGDTALPARGMGELPRQLAARLDPAMLRLGATVMQLEPGAVVLAGGERLRARDLVIATDATAAAALLAQPAPPTRGTTCLYFAAEQPPFAGPCLVLDGDGRGPVYSLLCPSNLSAHYAPAGSALITVNCFGTATDPEVLAPLVCAQLRGWFGEQVDGWRQLATYRLPAALPAQQPPVTAPMAARPLGEGLWRCGEGMSPPSIHWALASGQMTAAALLAGRGGHA